MLQPQFPKISASSCCKRQTIGNRAASYPRPCFSIDREIPPQPRTDKRLNQLGLPFWSFRIDLGCCSNCTRKAVGYPQIVGYHPPHPCSLFKFLGRVRKRTSKPQGASLCPVGIRTGATLQL